MHRQLRDASFADALLPENVGRNAPLEQLDALLAWEPLAEVVRDLYAAPAGACDTATQRSPAGEGEDAGSTGRRGLI